MEGNTVPRMRSIQQCADYFKEHDPQTLVTYWRIRGLVLDGKIPYITTGKNGKAKYINLDLLIEYFNNENVQPPQQKLIKPLRFSKG